MTEDDLEAFVTPLQERAHDPDRRAIRHARIFAFCANMAVWIAIGAAVVAWWNGWSLWPTTQI